MEIAGLSEGTRHDLSKEGIEDKSAQLLVKLIRCPDAATREEIYRWIEEDPAHAVAFAEAEAAWEAAKGLKAGCVGTSTSGDIGALSRHPMTRPARDDGRAVARPPEAKRRSP